MTKELSDKVIDNTQKGINRYLKEKYEEDGPLAYFYNDKDEVLLKEENKIGYKKDIIEDLRMLSEMVESMLIKHLTEEEILKELYRIGRRVSFVYGSPINGVYK